MKIKIIAIDIDGVLTNNTVTIDARNEEYKTIHYRDLDAVHGNKDKNILFVLVTGEDTPLVDLIADRFGIRYVQKGAKNKKEALEHIAASHEVSLQEIAYIGDSDRDAAALECCGLSFVPANATLKAKKAANIHLEVNGGHGVLYEMIEYLIVNKII